MLIIIGVKQMKKYNVLILALIKFYRQTGKTDETGKDGHHKNNACENGPFDGKGRKAH